MNIRTLSLSLFATIILSQTSSSFAMEESMKRVGEHAAQKLLEAGTKVVEKLPKSINIQVRPADLWWPTLSVAGAISIYNGLSQSLATYYTDEELNHKRKSNGNAYYHAASKVLVGLISLAGSYAIWCCR